MKEINRNNYEMYCIDYLEGNLSKELQAEFEAFLAVNPDISEDLHLLSETKPLSLIPEDISFKEKENLKKTEEFDEGSEWRSIAFFEGDLEKAEANDFQKLLETDSLLKDEYEKLKQTRLFPDKNVIFVSKDKLKRVPVLSITRNQFNRIYAVAAVLIVFLMSYTFWYSIPTNNNYSGIASKRNDKPMEVLIGSHDVLLFQNTEQKVNELPENVVIESKPDKPVFNRNDIKPAFLASLTQPSIEEKDYPLIPTLVRDFPDDYRQGNLLASSSSDALSMKEYATTLFKREILKQQEETIDPKKLQFAEIAYAGMNGISNLTNNKVKFKTDISEDGKLMAFAFDAGFFGFSRSKSQK